MIRPKTETKSRHNKTTRPSPKERKAAYVAVAARSNGVCEHCLSEPAESIHHRLYRSRGGEDEVTNLIALCGTDNTSGCHGLAHTGAGGRIGLSVASGSDPASVTFTNALGTRILLLPNGKRQAVI